MNKYINIANKYSMHNGSALDKFCTFGVIDKNHQEEIEIELDFLIAILKKLRTTARKALNQEALLKLHDELNELHELKEEIVNPDTTPIMER